MRFRPSQTGCPIGCRYCVITQVACRRNLWNQKFLIGINKAVTIINPPPDLSNKKSLDSFYSFPLELLEGDRVGFNAISDPFWPKFAQELEYFLTQVAPIAKVVTCVTKFPVSERMMLRLSQIENFQLNISLTGLDQIERGSGTAERLENLRLAKKYGVQAFPIVHPYIAGMSDLSFLPALKDMGYDFIDVKGLRYDQNMSSWMSQSSQKYYVGTEGREILPEDGWRDLVQESGLGIKSLRIWNEENQRPNPRMERCEAEKRVTQLLQYANITSSDSDEAVIKAAIQRRL